MGNDIRHGISRKFSISLSLRFTLESGVNACSRCSENVAAFSLSRFAHLLSAFLIGGIDIWALLSFFYCLLDCMVIFIESRNIVFESFILRIC
jgi:hypothetical protein